VRLYWPYRSFFLFQCLDKEMVMILADALRATLVKPHQGSRGFVQEESQRIIECFVSEGTFRGHLAQPPCHKQGHLQLDQVSQSPIQPALNVSKDGASTTSLGNLFQCFTTLIGKNVFLLSSLNLPSLSLKPLFLVLLQQDLLKRFSPSFL